MHLWAAGQSKGDYIELTTDWIVPVTDKPRNATRLLISLYSSAVFENKIKPHSLFGIRERYTKLSRRGNCPVEGLY